jgi:hypothetical protein
MRRGLVVLVCVLAWAPFAGCGLNPQPHPPEESATGNAGGSSSGGSGSSNGGITIGSPDATVGDASSPVVVSEAGPRTSDASFADASAVDGSGDAPFADGFGADAPFADASSLDGSLDDAEGETGAQDAAPDAQADGQTEAPSDGSGTSE